MGAENNLIAKDSPGLVLSFITWAPNTLVLPPPTMVAFDEYVSYGLLSEADVWRQQRPLIKREGHIKELIPHVMAEHSNGQAHYATFSVRHYACHQPRVVKRQHFGHASRIVKKVWKNTPHTDMCNHWCSIASTA